MVHLSHKITTGHLPTSEYELVKAGTVLGSIQIRHRASCGVGVPQRMASHVYYEIYPEHRLKGYGTLILTLGLQEAMKLGLKEVIVTCMEDNIGSKKIIEANGGVYIEEGVIPQDGTKMLKYRITLGASSQK